MTRQARLIMAAVFAAGLVGSAVAEAQPPGVGPNGENGGLTAKFVDVKGVRTRYYDEGSGEPLVLIHGSGFAGTASANTWVPVIPLLAKRFHVYAPDKLASGMTDNPKSDDDFSIRGEVQHVVDFIETLRLGKVHLVGQSRGGGCAFLVAVNHPDLVKTLVVIDSSTASPPAGDDKSNRVANLTETCPKEPATAWWPCNQASHQYDRSTITPDLVAAATFMENLPKAQETVRRRTAEVRRKLSGVSAEMVYDAYRRIEVENVLQMPVLIYWGKNDPSVLPIEGEQLFNIIAETNPYARLLFINRAGHFHYREHPDEFTHTVTSFIDYWVGLGASELAAAKR